MISPDEWIKQAQDVLETARVLLKARRFDHSTIFSHMAIEKALKALYTEKLKQTPPRTHNLVLLLDSMRMKPEDDVTGQFLIKMNSAVMTVRYPVDLDFTKSQYAEEFANEACRQAEKMLAWIKAML